MKKSNGKKTNNTTTKGQTTMKKTTKKAKTENTNPFTTLLKNYSNNPTDGNALYDLATAVTYSVLKKCIDVSQNKTLEQVRRSIAKDKKALDNIAYANANAYEVTYNTEGERLRKIKNKDLEKGLSELVKQTLGDGIDLVNDAVVAILEETAKQTEREPDKLTDLERPYITRRLKRKVWIKTADSVNGWETVTTTPIQEIYKAVRRSIDQSRAIQTEPRNGYTYLEDISHDSESDADSVIYRRFGRYADIGGYATDYNGREIAYTTDEQTAKDLDTFVGRLNLTARQAKVLQLRQGGYSYRAIATYLGIDHSNVVRVCRQIQTKALAIGLIPTE